MKITINKYNAIPDKITLGTAGSYGVEILEFEFSQDWDDLTKTVSFYPVDDEAATMVLSSDNICDVPQEMTAHTGYGSILVQGVKNGVQILSLEIVAEILATKAPATTPAGSPTPTEMEQVLDYLGEARDIAQSVRDDADAGEFKGDKGDKGDSGDKGDKGDKGDTGNPFAYWTKNALQEFLRALGNNETVFFANVSDDNIIIGANTLLSHSVYKAETGEHGGSENSILIQNV